MDAPSSDPLICLRRSIASNHPPITTSSLHPTPPSDAIENLAIATHLQFADPEHVSFPLDTPTRFLSSEKPVDLRSIYFAWQKKDVAIPDYIASAQQLNEELSGGDGRGSKVQNLVFVERLDLITWLEGASEESEYIKALETDVTAARSAQVASGAAGRVSTVPSSTAGARAGKSIDPRLQEIYNGERKMGDRNSVLRGIKPTVRSFSLKPYTRIRMEKSNIYAPGLFPHSQNRRDLSRSQPPPTWRPSSIINGRHSSHLHRVQHIISGLATKEAIPASRPHNTALTLGVVSAADVEHQILPRSRHIHPARQRAGRIVGGHGHNSPHLAPPSVHRRLPTAALHPRRHARAVQARLLEPGRGRLYHGSNMAVPRLQVAIPARTVPARARYLRRLASGGRARHGARLGPWRQQRPDREVERPPGRAGPVAGSRGGGGHLGSSRGEHASQRMGKRRRAGHDGWKMKTFDHMALEFWGKGWGFERRKFFFATFFFFSSI